MNTNDPGREPEPTDAELLRGRADNLYNGGPCSEWVRLQDLIDRRGMEYLSGARPMPDTPAPVCYAPTSVFGKFRTCELPAGHEGRHESHLGGETVWWENNGPECEHGHLARVCVTCELIAAEARIADLERENAALRAERDRMKESCRIVLGFGKAIISDASINSILGGAPTTLLFQIVDEEHTIGMDATGYGRDNLEPGDGNVQIVFTKAESVDVVIDTLVKIKGAIESAVSAGKEAPDAE